jgi:hypothetical protein
MKLRFLKSFKPKIVILLLVVILFFRSIFFTYFPSINKDASRTIIAKPDSSRSKLKACIFILARNEDLNDLNSTITQFEKAFNRRFGYPYVFMNNEPFSDLFKSSIAQLTQSKVEFGQIPADQWQIPPWIDMKELDRRLNTSLKGKINMAQYK